MLPSVTVKLIETATDVKIYRGAGRGGFMNIRTAYCKLRSEDTRRKLTLAKLTMLLKLKTAVNLSDVFRRPGYVFRMVNELLLKNLNSIAF